MASIIKHHTKAFKNKQKEFILSNLKKLLFLQND